MKLTLDKAKQICSDFEVVTRKDLGKKACLHLMPDKEMCRIGSHFVCELALFKARKGAKEQRDNRDAISASRINLLDACSRKYHFLREKYLKSPAGDPVFLRVGDAFGTARARVDQGLPFRLEDIRKDIPATDLAKVRAALRFYMENPPYPPGTVTCEHVCHFEFEGTWYLGYADAVTKDQETVVEWKYAVMNYDHLKLARQAAVYLHGVPSASSFVAMRMKKSSHRPKKSGDESMAEFEERIFESLMKDPSKAIVTTTIKRDEMDVEGVLREMKNSYEKVLPAMRAAGFPPNYSACGMCDFQTVCGDRVGQSTSQLVRRLSQ